MLNPTGRLLRHSVIWAVIFAALLFMFHHFESEKAEDLSDEQIEITVLTENGPTTMTAAEYLTQAVAGEMPASYGAEALKAQAVAIRSYVLAGARHDNADVCTDHRCCLSFCAEDELRSSFGENFDQYMNAIRSAVEETDGQVLTYQGCIIRAAFHASSAGSTENSADVWTPLPYLVAVSSPETAATVPGLVTTKEYSPEDLAALLGLDPHTPPETWLSGCEPDASGRVRYLRIAGQTLSGGFVRSALGLRSTDFSVQYENGSFCFTAAGYGHGVGMSQEGARILASEGWTYDEILAHYYPGTELSVN